MHVPAYRQTDRYIHIHNLIKKNLYKKDREGIVVHTFNYSTQEAGASSRPAYFITSSDQLEPQNCLKIDRQKEQLSQKNLIVRMERRCRYLIKNGQKSTMKKKTNS